MTARHRPSRPKISARRVFSLLSTLLIALFLFLMWPQTLGGKVAYVRVDGHSMDGTYKTGDLVVVRRQSHYTVGDIVDFRVPKGEFGAGAQVIHRIVGGNGTTGFTTKGDNKPHTDDWHPKTTDVVGAAWIHLADVGNTIAGLSRPYELGALTATLTVLSMLVPALFHHHTKEPSAPKGRRWRKRRRPMPALAAHRGVRQKA